MVDKLNSDQTQVDLNETRNKVNEILDALNRQIIIPWSPSEISTVAWWDASDTSTIEHTLNTVSQWKDKSGNGVNLTIPSNSVAPTTNTRTLNNLNVMEYAGTDSGLVNNSFSFDRTNQDFLISFMLNIDSSAVNVQHFLFHLTNATSAGKRMMVRSTNSNTGIQVYGGDGTTNKVFGASGLSLRGSNSLITIKLDSSASSFIRLNGAEEASGDSGNHPFNRFKLGTNENGAFAVEGFFAECVAYTDDTMVERIEGYLAHKWGQDSSLDSGHAYKDWNTFLRSSWGYNRL
jgi:hypothetical protein